MKKAALASLVCVMAFAEASGLINPKFTPADLCHEARRITVVSLESTGDEFIMKARVTRVLKGETGISVFELGVAESAEETFASARDGTNPIVAVQVEGFRGAGVKSAPVAALCIGSGWLGIYRGDGILFADALPTSMDLRAVWGGDAAMFVKAAVYSLAHPDTANFPATAGVRWDKPKSIARLPAPATQIRVTAVNGKPGLRAMLEDGRICLLSRQEDGRFEVAVRGSRGKAVRTQLKATKRWPTPVSDFDGDGLLDSVGILDDGIIMLRRTHSGKLVRMTARSGETAYAAKRDLADVYACDFNLDGREDLVLQSASAGLQFFFNRGFFCFGFAKELDQPLKEIRLAVASCVADLDSNGLTELYACMPDGTISCVPLAGTPSVSAWIELPAEASPGPRTVRIRHPDGVPVGARVVAAGRPLLVGRRRSGVLAVGQGDGAGIPWLLRRAGQRLELNSE